MAPQKTLVINQQSQTISAANQAQQSSAATAKPRKRKGKQNDVVSAQEPVKSDVKKPVAQVDIQPSQKENLSLVSSETSTPPVVPSDRKSLSKHQPVKQQVPSLVKQPSIDISKQTTAKAMPALTTTNAPVIGKQLSTDETDDIDAGIELDESSNSGSSVKDISEDPSKSASVSPIMAQSNLVNDTNVKSGVGVRQHSVEVSSIEQLAGSLCMPVKTAKKTGSTTKQQLAANQQVIDADEQQLQNKLAIQQQKQPRHQQLQQLHQQTQGVRKVSLTDSNSLTGVSMCKICEQHVYQMERMLAEKSIYHKKCFRCYQCKVQLTVNNYSSHEGQVYCKAHHRQLFQPQVKLDNEDDVDIVAKSTSKPVDEYLSHRGRLSELSFSFLQPKPEGIRQRQMIICENEPAELPKDVVRSDTKLDDGIDQLNLNLNNILEKFERGTASSGEDSQPTSAGVVIEKPSFNIKQTLMAFESRMANPVDSDLSSEAKVAERPVVRKLTNLNGFLNRQDSDKDSDSKPVLSSQTKPLAVRRSESLMLRLKKYESRIAGEQVDDDDSSDDDENNNGVVGSEKTKQNGDSKSVICNGKSKDKIQSTTIVPKKLTSFNLSSLKNQWENGDINNRRNDDEEDGDYTNKADGSTTGDKNLDSSSPVAQKNEELSRIRQQLALRKLGESGSVKNIYENAIKEAQLQQQQQTSRRDSNDLSALNGFSTSEIQQRLLQNSSNDSQIKKTPTTPDKDHFQLNFTNKANKLKERFELGLITNTSRDDSDQSDDDNEPAMTKLEQIRQEKLEDLSVFTEGEIKAREARSLFQQIDRRISASNGVGKQPTVNSRSLASIGASMRTKLTNQMNNNSIAQ